MRTERLLWLLTPACYGVKPVGVPATPTGIRGVAKQAITFQPGHADVPMDESGAC